MSDVFTIYTVKSGDTLWAIGNQHVMNWRAIAAANQDTLPDPNKLRVGQKIKVPNRAGFMAVIDAILEAVGWIKGLGSLAQDLMNLGYNPSREQLNQVIVNCGLGVIDAILWRLHPIAGGLFTLGWFIVSYWRDLAGWWSNTK
jgi:hypothetical protein